MKKTFFLLMAICIAATVRAQKIEHTFWDSAFGVSSEQVYNNLVANNLQPILTEDGIFLKDNSIYSILFQTIGMKFTSEDAFYNIFGYNKFEPKVVSSYMPMLTLTVATPSQSAYIRATMLSSFALTSLVIIC